MRSGSDYDLHYEEPPPPVYRQRKHRGDYSYRRKGSESEIQSVYESEVASADSASSCELVNTSENSSYVEDSASGYDTENRFTHRPRPTSHRSQSRDHKYYSKPIHKYREGWRSEYLPREDNRGAGNSPSLSEDCTSAHDDLSGSSDVDLGHTLRHHRRHYRLESDSSPVSSSTSYESESGSDYQTDCCSLYGSNSSCSSEELSAYEAPNRSSRYMHCRPTNRTDNNWHGTDINRPMNCHLLHRHTHRNTI